MRNIMFLKVSIIFLITVLLGACNDQLDPVSAHEETDYFKSFEHTAGLAASDGPNECEDQQFVVFKP
jgi:hypothetical protein